MSAFMLEYYAGMCGWTLARAHARAGDPVAIDAYLGAGDDFDTAITDFSQRYADQNEQDYQASSTPSATGGSTRSKESETTTRTAVPTTPAAGVTCIRVRSSGASPGYGPWTADPDYCRAAGRV